MDIQCPKCRFKFNYPDVGAQGMVTCMCPRCGEPFELQLTLDKQPVSVPQQAMPQQDGTLPWQTQGGAEQPYQPEQGYQQPEQPNQQPEQVYQQPGYQQPGYQQPEQPYQQGQGYQQPGQVHQQPGYQQPGQPYQQGQGYQQTEYQQEPIYVEQPSSNTTRNVLIGVLAALVLGLGGLFAYLYLNGKLPFGNSGSDDLTTEVSEPSKVEVGSYRISGTSGSTTVSGSVDVNANDISGHYGYGGKASLYDLQGVIHDDGTVTINEYNKGQKGGKFSGTIKAGNVIEGTYTAPGGQTSNFTWSLTKLSLADIEAAKEQAEKEAKAAKAALKAEKAKAAAQMGSGTPYVVVDGVHVRLRFTPEINSYNILSDSRGHSIYPYKGEYLQYLGEAGDFYYVRYNGYDLYISKRHAYITYL
ncbi:MAG: hypothetical protein J5980_00250 [Muribaculaceae bacterium]|nr:hypothetical protein [Muribaculaceae bacterium]